MFGVESPVRAQVPRLSSLSTALQVFFTNRLVLIVVSALTGRLFYDVAGHVQSVYYLWHRWDVIWYIRVADHGYRWLPPPAQSDLAFFPLFPLVIHLLTLITPLSAYAAGLVVTSLSFALALYLLHRLVLLDFEREVAERTITYLGLFPTALFFFAAYSEALYLACSVGCIYALRLRRWWVAGLCGMAAVLTRQLGLLLVIPFVIELFGHSERERPAPSFRRPDVLSLALIPAGLLAFVAFLQVRLGNGLLFLRAQTAWQRTFAPPWQGPLLDISRIGHLYPHISEHTRRAEQALMALDLAFLLLFIALCVLGALWLPRSYTAYTVAVLLAILMTPATGAVQPLPLLSLSRFEVTLFPPFIVLGILGRNRGFDRLFFSLSLVLLALFTNVFVRGRWIA
jgi:hypothetical protein